MKRSEALAILSRDHHHALVVAQRLTRADAGSAAPAKSSFLEFWEQEGRHHFQLEEELLLPAYAAYGDARQPLVLRVLGDHVEIRAKAARLATVTHAQADVTREQADVTREQADARTGAELEALHELGACLSAHVRLEERELFPLIEAAMPAGELLALARSLAAGRA